LEALLLATTLIAAYVSLKHSCALSDSAEVIIGLGPSAFSYQKLVDLLAKHSSYVVKTIETRKQVNAIVARVPLTSEAFDLFNEIEAEELAEYIEPNARIISVQFVPNDPHWTNFTHQWGPQKVNASWAWDKTIGDRNILVAVPDTGIDYNHEDLQANYVQGGYDWVNSDNDPMDDDATIGSGGHGTHCAGIIAAQINNSKGIAGLAQVRVMAEKCLDDQGWGTFADCADAIIHAVDQGARIVSISWGTYYRSEAIHNAVKYAHDAGVLLVAGSGNNGWTGKFYPAAFDEVIAVTATDTADTKSSFANYGNWVELAAPGGDNSGYADIWSTIRNNDYGGLSGTSEACPHVVGVAALVWSCFPNMTRDQLRVHLRKTATDLGALGFDDQYGYGLIDANASVSQPPPDHDLLVLNWQKPAYAELYVPVKINATILNYGLTDESNVVVQLLANGTVADTQTIGSLTSGVSSTVNFTWTRFVERDYNLSVHIMPANGETAIEDNEVCGVVTKEVGVIRVPQQYPTIQEAVDAANPGDTIRVASGQYTETVNIYKNGLKLIGEGKTATVVDCANAGSWGFVATNVQGLQISGFKIMNTFGYEDPILVVSGILLCNVRNATITENELKWNYGDQTWENGGAITITSWSCYNVVKNNTMIDNRCGIRLEYAYSDWNLIKENYLKENSYGIILLDALNNLVYHNNIDSSITQLRTDDVSSNQWFGRWNVTGNFWSNYTGIDDGSNNRTARDGVGDTNIPHQRVDPNPLMARWMPGDITHDGKVGPPDFARIAVAYGKTCNDTDWKPLHVHADLDEDGKVGPADMAIVSRYFGKDWKYYWGFP